MGGWDAITASMSGVNPSAYSSQGGPMYRPVLKPVEYTDDTLITVPVLDLKTLQEHGSPDGEAGEGKFQSRSGFFRHKSSSFQSVSKGKVNVCVRQVTRRDYLKHYAKDGQGRYAGTEDPADDCILDGKDSNRWRGQDTEPGITAAGGKPTGDKANPKAPMGIPDAVKDESVAKGNRPHKRLTGEVKASDSGTATVEVNEDPTIPDVMGISATNITHGGKKSRFNLFRGLRGGGEAGDGIIH